MITLVYAQNRLNQFIYFPPVAFVLFLFPPRSHFGPEELIQAVLFPTLTVKMIIFMSIKLK